MKDVTVDEGELSRFLLKPGDLLLTEGGDWDKVGRTCIWRGEIGQCLHQNHVFKARGVVSEWLPAWAELFLNSSDARTYFAGASKQTTNLASINSTQLKSCPFPVPPLAEQHRIVARVEHLRRLCAGLRDRLQQARNTQSHLADALVNTAARHAGVASVDVTH
jgi:type I restriction enzyme S subunit